MLCGVGGRRAGRLSVTRTSSALRLSVAILVLPLAPTGFSIVVTDKRIEKSKEFALTFWALLRSTIYGRWEAVGSKVVLWPGRNLNLHLFGQKGEKIGFEQETIHDWREGL